MGMWWWLHKQEVCLLFLLYKVENNSFDFVRKSQKGRLEMHHWKKRPEVDAAKFGSNWTPQD